MNIQTKLTPYNFMAMKNKTNSYIVIHYTASTGTAKNNVDYFAREKLGASAHYFVDDNSIWQCVLDKDKSWHCGGGLQGNDGHTFYGICTNSNSIGIEMCCKRRSNNTLYVTEQTIRNTIKLVKELMSKYNVSIDRVIRHYDVTGKICPAQFVDTVEWNRFKNMLTESEDEAMTTEERTKFNELVNAVSELTSKVDELTKPKMIYNYIDDNMPKWARPTIQKLVDKGILQGDENGLGLTYNDLRYLVWNDRAGLYD